MHVCYQDVHDQVFIVRPPEKMLQHHQATFFFTREVPLLYVVFIMVSTTVRSIHRYVRRESLCVSSLSGISLVVAMGDHEEGSTVNQDHTDTSHSVQRTRTPHGRVADLLLL